jgi:hypothetical protein
VQLGLIPRANATAEGRRQRRVKTPRRGRVLTTDFTDYADFKMHFFNLCHLRNLWLKPLFSLLGVCLGALGALGGCLALENRVRDTLGGSVLP